MPSSPPTGAPSRTAPCAPARPLHCPTTHPVLRGTCRLRRLSPRAARLSATRRRRRRRRRRRPAAAVGLALAAAPDREAGVHCGDPSRLLRRADAGGPRGDEEQLARDVHRRARPPRDRHCRVGARREEHLQVRLRLEQYGRPVQPSGPRGDDRHLDGHLPGVRHGVRPPRGFRRSLRVLERRRQRLRQRRRRRRGPLRIGVPERLMRWRVRRPRRRRQDRVRRLRGVRVESRGRGPPAGGAPSGGDGFRCDDRGADHGPPATSPRSSRSPRR